MTDTPTQMSRAMLKYMSTDEIVDARKAGQLDELLAGRDPGRQSDQEFTPPGADQGARGPRFKDAREWLRSLPPEEIVRLHREGKLDGILSGQPW